MIIPWTKMMILIFNKNFFAISGNANRERCKALPELNFAPVLISAGGGKAWQLLWQMKRRKLR